jgi:hypothetical protein
MTNEIHEHKFITGERMLELIQDGREAIERCLLKELLRSISRTQEGHDAEMAELYTLLNMYNTKMARFEHPRIDAHAANDEKGARD